MKWSAAACLLMLLGTFVYAGAQQQAPSIKVNQQPQKAVSQQDPAMRAGHAVYVDNCSACHTESGVGPAQLFPALKGDPVVLAADPTAAIHFVLEGGKGAATDHAPTGPDMPAFGWKLSDQQIAAVMTYVRNSWGNAAPAVSLNSVHSVRQEDCTGLEARLHLQSRFDRFCKNHGQPTGVPTTSGAGSDAR